MYLLDIELCVDMEKELERTEVKAAIKKPVTLEGDAAILLWLEGKGAWNKWMEENPKADVNFSRVDFSYKALKERFPYNENLRRLIEGSEDEDVISFNGYKFSGEAYFWDSTFSGYAGFDSAIFSGTATFYDVTFSGYASFHFATFSDGVNFIDAKFSDEANFNDATFSDYAEFGGAIFSDAAHFTDATFSD